MGDAAQLNNDARTALGLNGPPYFHNCCDRRWGNVHKRDHTQTNPERKEWFFKTIKQDYGFN
eukprot:11056617-Lingulodinium_polyedra.AAC.1